MGFARIDGSEIEACLKSQTRQYLMGNLTVPQSLKHIADDDIEAGISSYSDATFEPAHRHARAKEYQYVLEGMTEYRDVQSGEVHRFIAGDFYVIYPGTSYIQRVKQNTRILFFKFPGGNDKENLDVPESILAWAKEPLRVRRQDLQAGGATPLPNSLKPAVAVAVFDGLQRLLLVKRRDSGYWAMPGGTMELGDSVETCGHREVLEETGALIAINGVIGIYSDPQTIIAYSDGEVRREFSVLLAATSSTESLRRDDESTEVGWISRNDLSRYPMVPAQQRRIADALSYLDGGGVSLR